jgi:probable HAF family extracellular repeat protein
VWTVLAPPNGDTWSAPLDVDDRGDIVGVGIVGTTSTTSALPLHAFVMMAGQPAVDLGFAPESAAHRISSAGIVGIFETDAGTTHAFFYSTSAASPIDLGTLGGNNSAAYAINARGDAVGVADTDAGAHHACLFTHGTVLDLGTLGGDRSDARGIDDNGNIVGNSVYTDGSIHPFLYRAGVLKDILPTDSHSTPYTMARVEMISNGTAIGWGVAADQATHCIEWAVLR